jgi:hypothetical protein
VAAAAVRIGHFVLVGQKQQDPVQQRQRQLWTLDDSDRSTTFFETRRIDSALHHCCSPSQRAEQGSDRRREAFFFDSSVKKQMHVPATVKYAHAAHCERDIINRHHYRKDKDWEASNNDVC